MTWKVGKGLWGELLPHILQHDDCRIEWNYDSEGCPTTVRAVEVERTRFTIFDIPIELENEEAGS